MEITERVLSLPISVRSPQFLDQIQKSHYFRLPRTAMPIRLAVTTSDAESCECEVGILDNIASNYKPASIFNFRKRRSPRHDTFNSVFIVPTGIGAEIGGHAGDSTPVVRVLAEICDELITHPNAVNASDLNEMTENTIYVEGSVLTRFLMGTIGLSRVRSNRLLVIIDDHEDELIVHAAVNAVNAARASFGVHCSHILKMASPVRMTAQYSASGRAAGHVQNVGALCEALERKRGSYDAVAIASVIHVPAQYHKEYFGSGGQMVNPWGGVEALLTHAVSSLFNVPVAHSPMLECPEVAHADFGVVEPRLAAESVSMAFLHCILKGLHRSPRIITDYEEMLDGNSLTVENVSCMVIPIGCIGVSVLAALRQGIPVVAVRENSNLMQNDLSILPWSKDQYFEVDNYFEAAGILTAMRAGVDPATIRRPLTSTIIEEVRGQKSARVHEHKVGN